MHRWLAFAITLISSYCLAEAFASSQGELGSKPQAHVFTAEIQPVVHRLETGPEARADKPEPQTHTTVMVSSPTPQAAGVTNGRPAPASNTSLSLAEQKKKVPAPPRRQGIHPEPNADTSIEFDRPASFLPEPRLTIIATTERDLELDRCSNRMWSKPDSAGVPVLICK